MNRGKKFRIVGGIVGVIYAVFNLVDIIYEKPDDKKTKKWWQLF